MKSKKMSMLLATIFTFTLVFGASKITFASSPNDVQKTTIQSTKPDINFSVTMQNTEIKDIKTLYNRARNNITDVHTDMDSEYTITDNKTGKSKKGKALITTQHLRTLKSTNEVKDVYATTTFTPDPASVTSSSSSPSQSEGDYDPATYSVYGYSTVYWESSTYNGNSYRAITEATGGWTIEDSSVSISSREVDVYCSGQTPYGYESQLDPNKPASNSFTYYYTNHFDPVSTSDGERLVGITTKATLNRNSSTWTFTLNNKI